MTNPKTLIKQGEGVSVEFKECRKALSRDVYETVCAFLNRHGGTLLLGVNDAGLVTGIDQDSVAQVKKDFVTTSNNSQKINPACYLSVDEEQMDDKTILRIYVPESSQVHRCNGRIYDRNEDGDFDITDHTRQVAALYHRKQATYSENKVYPYASMADIREDLIAQCRKIAVLRRGADHPWGKIDDLALLKSAQLYQIDRETGKSGLTLAGILLLGKDDAILSVVSHHRTDLILRKVNVDRYDDRDFVTTNLVESYDRIMAFIAKHLPDPFYLEGTMSISIRDTIFREVASNILIHREYMNAFPAKLIIERGVVRTENSNKPHGFGLIDPVTFTPFPKNPVIAHFFQQIGRADELGSGMHKLMKYGRIFGGSDPELIEGDVFRIIIRYPDFDAPQTGQTTLTRQIKRAGAQSGGESGGESEVGRQILAILITAPLSKAEISGKLGKAKPNRYLDELMARLVQSGNVERTIPDKPKSRLQKYRLTAKGRAVLKAMQISGLRKA